MRYQLYRKLTEYDHDINSISLRKAKIVYNFGLSECSRVNGKRAIPSPLLNKNSSLTKFMLPFYKIKYTVVVLDKISEIDQIDTS